MTPRTLTLPVQYESGIAETLSTHGLGLQSSAALAQSVLRLSDFYIESSLDRATPWTEPWAQIASAAYYFPLNYARNQAVAQELKRVGFFSGLSSLIDMGAGHGSATFAFTDEVDFDSVTQIDRAQESFDLGQMLAPKQMRAFKTSARDVHEADDIVASHDHNRLAILASYVVTELERIPQSWLEAEALIIVEPSTREKSRKLLELREELISKGYFVWAPCTHQGACPLLTQSKKDWCHDRVHYGAPEWFQKMEEHLPMRNRTLTYSYLALRKTPPPRHLATKARLIGDTLIEKGKSRQAICRGPDREFLAWFPQRMQDAENPQETEFERGRLVELESGLIKKSDEIRVTSFSQIKIEST